MTEKPGSEPAFPTLEGNFVNHGIETHQVPGLTRRSYAAIQLRVPEAEEEWLNDMIRRARRMDYIQTAMSSLLRKQSLSLPTVASYAPEVADACLKLEAETREGK
jgi:hypothetical protein